VRIGPNNPAAVCPAGNNSAAGQLKTQEIHHRRAMFNAVSDVSW
jgi:hypothetical protein